MNRMVVYSTDENYVDLTLVSIVSLFRQYPEGGVTVCLLSNRVSEAGLEKLRNGVLSRGGTFLSFDVDEQLDAIRESGASEYTSFSAYARLLAPRLLHGKTDRFLYLDSDTLIVDRLDELFRMDLADKAFAIGYDCIRREYKQMIGLPSEKPYFNSGVLLVDVESWIRHRCSERIFQYMETVRSDFLFADQDYFSLVLSEDAAPLHPRFNFLTHFLLFTEHRSILRAFLIPCSAWAPKSDYEWALKHPSIYHFLGNTLGRPWFKESQNPLRPLYLKVAEEAGVPAVAQQSRPMEFYYRLQSFLHRILPQFLFTEVARLMYRVFYIKTYGK